MGAGRVRVHHPHKITEKRLTLEDMRFPVGDIAFQSLNRSGSLKTLNGGAQERPGLADVVWAVNQLTSCCHPACSPLPKPRASQPCGPSPLGLGHGSEVSAPA